MKTKYYSMYASCEDSEGENDARGAVLSPGGLGMGGN